MLGFLQRCYIPIRSPDYIFKKMSERDWFTKGRYFPIQNPNFSRQTDKESQAFCNILS